jgi:NadR type nicotinamide-nucleotide adenylyltransferase
MSSIRIVITGSECTGKSTLTRKLGEYYQVETVPEYLRNYFEMKHGRLSIDDAVPIARGQLEAEQKVIKNGCNPVICDTDTLSSIIYSNHYFGSCPEQIETIFKNLKTDLYLLCCTDIPWQADGQRDRPEGRQYMQDLFKNELKKRELPYIELSGSIEERARKAVEEIDLLLLEP